MPIRKSDIFRSDIISPPELSSDGYYVYLPLVSSVSTTSSTKIVVIHPIPDGEGLTLPAFDHPAKSGDIAHITGSSGADGYYTINTILSDTSFTVTESISDSTGGFVDFIYPVGASLVGFDSSGLHITNANNVQDAIKDVNQNAVSTTGTNSHETLRHLIHFIETGGPGHGFSVAPYKEITPSASVFPTHVTWYIDNTKSQKIVEKILVWTGAVPTTITWNLYDTDGITIVQSAIDTINYVNNIFEVNRTRTILP
jgi:hypothetical protein